MNDALRDKIIRLICTGLPGPNKCVAPNCECYEQNGIPVAKAIDELLRAEYVAQPSEETLRAENVLLTAVLAKAREALFVSIKGTPDDLQRALGSLNLACKAHWDWQTERQRTCESQP